MANLFWRTKQGTKSLLATPFKTEEEFEKTVFETPEILEDITLIKRQVRGGGKSGIPDIVGVDVDGNVCIVEMKNVTVDPSIISQVLQYAFWAETNPDSIKSLWLEYEDKPDDLQISWDTFQVRIVVIAPSILRTTLDIVNKINYPVDLIEVTRWVEEDNQLLLVNELEEEKRLKPAPVSGLQAYGEEFYKKEYNKKSAVEFIKYIREVESIVKEKGWPLETKYNKHHCNQAQSEAVEMTKYDNQWKEAVYYIEPGSTKTRDFLPLFEASYKKVTGE